MYRRVILAILVVMLTSKALLTFRLGFSEHRVLVDFDVFYIAAQSVWAGDIDCIYHSAYLMQVQKRAEWQQPLFTVDVSTAVWSVRRASCFSSPRCGLFSVHGWNARALSCDVEDDRRQLFLPPVDRDVSGSSHYNCLRPEWVSDRDAHRAGLPNGVQATNLGRAGSRHDGDQAAPCDSIRRLCLAGTSMDDRVLSRGRRRDEFASFDYPARAEGLDGLSCWSTGNQEGFSSMGFTCFTE